MLPKGVAMPYAKRKRLIEWQRQIELLHIFVNPYISFLETNEREIMDQLSPLGNSLKNKKEESHVNTME